MFTENNSYTESTSQNRTTPRVQSAGSDQADEQALIRALLRDDAGAWRTFNARYSRLMYSCIARVMARFSTVTSGDDVREVYATLCVQLLSNDKKKLRSFEADRGTKFGSWLGMLAVHATYDYLRAVRRAPALSPLVEAETLSSEMPSPFEQSLRRERALVVTSLMNSLSDKDKQFFKLYFADGLTPEEVARRMGISIKTVYSKKHKITAKLEAMLGDERLAA